jgi:hypothetical protein
VEKPPVNILAYYWFPEFRDGNFADALKLLG